MIHLGLLSVLRSDFSVRYEMKAIRRTVRRYYDLSDVKVTKRRPSGPFGEVADMRAATLEKGMLVTVGGEITAGGSEARDTGANRFNTYSVTARGQSHHFGGRLTPLDP